MILYSFKHFLQIREKMIVGNNLYGLKPIIEANDTTIPLYPHVILDKVIVSQHEIKKSYLFTTFLT